MECYCIAMHHEVEKKKAVQADFDSAGLRVQFYDGVNGREPLSKEHEALLSVYGKTVGHPSVVGCSLSHYTLWSQLSKRTTPPKYTLICESDVTFSSDFVDRLDNCLAETDAPFDVLYVGNKNFFPDDQGLFRRLCAMLLFGNKPRTKQISETRYLPDITLATHCYIVTPEGINKLLTNLKYKLGEHVDQLMLRAGGSLQLQAVFPPLAHQRSPETSASNIASSDTFPVSLNYAMNKEMPNGFSASYYMNCPIAEIWGFPLNFWTAVFLIIGIIALWYGVPLWYLFIGFIICVSLDVVAAWVMGLNTSQKKMYLISTLFTLLLPTLAFASYFETQDIIDEDTLYHNSL